MSAITGNEYIERIDNLFSNIWVDGQKINCDISNHKAFKGVIQSQAKLYDLQHMDSIKHIMTYTSPTTRNQIGTSYMQPKTFDDLIKRRKMIERWARASGGMMGRSPDYMNTVLMSFAASADLLKGKENCFPDHLIRFYEWSRERDNSFTHTFINPQVNRSILYFEDSNEPIAAKIVGETEEGLVIKGARLLATQGGITDEILVFSPGGITDKANAFMFSIPSNSTGLKFIARESFVAGDSSFNYPLSSRFEEMDSIVVFDNVVVPWERVFFYKNLEVANSFKRKSAFVPFALHQVVTRQIVKTELVLGVAKSIVKTINSGEYQHVKQKVSEIIIGLETIKGLLTRAGNNAQKDEFGLMRPNEITLLVAVNTFSNLYPRMIELVQLLGSSGMVSIPTEKDFKSDIKDDLDVYLQGTTKNAVDRVKLFRLAWDLTMSAFGTRQTQYERFFFGDPILLANELYDMYDTNKEIDQLSQFLE